MARARPVPPSSAEQLTLEDWEQVLQASHEKQEPRDLATTGAMPDTDEVANRHDSHGDREAATQAEARRHPAATALLETPGALLTRTHLRQLGLERRAVDAVFRALPVVALPGYSRTMIRADEYRELVERSTYRDDGVRPMTHA